MSERLSRKTQGAKDRYAERLKPLTTALVVDLRPENGGGSGAVEPATATANGSAGPSFDKASAGTDSSSASAPVAGQPRASGARRSRWELEKGDAPGAAVPPSQAAPPGAGPSGAEAAPASGRSTDEPQQKRPARQEPPGAGGEREQARPGAEDAVGTQPVPVLVPVLTTSRQDGDEEMTPADSGAGVGLGADAGAGEAHAQLPPRPARQFGGRAGAGPAAAQPQPAAEADASAGAALDVSAAAAATPEPGVAHKGAAPEVVAAADAASLVEEARVPLKLEELELGDLDDTWL
eukprot:XP_001703313.1 predicted protein [Chlamydomonas reinhardtii]